MVYSYSELGAVRFTFDSGRVSFFDVGLILLLRMNKTSETNNFWAGMHFNSEHSITALLIVRTSFSQAFVCL